MTTNRVSPLAKEVAKIATTRNDAARRKLVLSLLELPKETLVANLEAAFESEPKARWVFPSILGTLADQKVPGARQALRPLLLDKDRSVSGNAAEVVRGYGWTEDCLAELAKLAERDAGDPRSSALIAVFEALGQAKSPEAFSVLLRVARARFKVPWRQGNLLEALGQHARPEARPLLERFADDAKAHPYVRLMAAAGLARLGDREALNQIRPYLEDKDLAVARSAASALHDLLGTTQAITAPQLEKLARWWDTHSRDVDARFQAFTARKRAARAAKR